MLRRRRKNPWTKLLERSLTAFARSTLVAARPARVPPVRKPTALRRRPTVDGGAWVAGLVVGAAGTGRFKLYRPSHVKLGERLPLLVMLHGCGQDADGFAVVTRMNRIAESERFVVLYPEQQRMANAQGCWNWFDTTHGRARGEAALILQAIDQACLLHGADRHRVAIAGLSAGASMAALLAARHPGRFKAVVMHSGIPPGTAHSPLSALGAMHGRRATKPLPAAPPAQGWPPLLVIHGTADAVVAPRNGRAAALVWAEAEGARPSTPRRLQRGKRHPMVATDFKHLGRTVATLVEVAGLAHAWSGGAAKQPYSDPRGPDASRLVWAFVAKRFDP